VPGTGGQARGRYARSLGLDETFFGTHAPGSWTSPPAIWCWKRSQTIAPMPGGRRGGERLRARALGCCMWSVTGSLVQLAEKVGVSEHAGFLHVMHEIIKSYSLALVETGDKRIRNSRKRGALAAAERPHGHDGRRRQRFGSGAANRAEPLGRGAQQLSEPLETSVTAASFCIADSAPRLCQVASHLQATVAAIEGWDSPSVAGPHAAMTKVRKQLPDLAGVVTSGGRVRRDVDTRGHLPLSHVALKRPCSPGSIGRTKCPHACPAGKQAPAALEASKSPLTSMRSPNFSSPRPQRGNTWLSIG